MLITIGIICFVLGYIVGNLISGILYSEKLLSLDRKYDRLLNIIADWQKIHR